MATKKIAKGHFKKLPPLLQPQTQTPVGKIVWKPLRIAGYKDYEICSNGTVRRNEKSQPAEHAGKILSTNLKDNLYPRVTLRASNGGRKSFTIHRLLAGEFLRPKKPGEVIRHLDGRPETPTAWTIAWGTVKENRRDHELHQLFFTLANPDPQIFIRGSILLDILIANKPIKTTAKKWGVSEKTAKALINGQRNRVELGFLAAVIDTWLSR
jgi:hypothetical protein